MLITMVRGDRLVTVRKPRGRLSRANVGVYGKEWRDEREPVDSAASEDNECQMLDIGDVLCYNRYSSGKC
jgi:hypothetical protein